MNYFARERDKYLRMCGISNQFSCSSEFNINSVSEFAALGCAIDSNILISVLKICIDSRYSVSCFHPFGNFDDF